METKSEFGPSIQFNTCAALIRFISISDPETLTFYYSWLFPEEEPGPAWVSLHISTHSDDTPDVIDKKNRRQQTESSNRAVDRQQIEKGNQNAQHCLRETCEVIWGSRS